MQTKLLLTSLVLLLLVMPQLSKAETEQTSLSISDSLKKLPAIKEGFMYDFQHKRGLNVLGLEIASYKGFSLDAAWIGIDGFGGVANYSLSSLPVQNLPILNYVQYLNIGYGLGYRTMALANVQGNPKSDNQLISGPVAFVKFKF